MAAVSQINALKMITRKKNEAFEQIKRDNKGFAAATDMFNRLYNIDKMKELITLKESNKANAKKEVNEMVNYFIFLILFLAVTIYARSSDASFRLTSVVDNQLLKKEFRVNPNSSIKKNFYKIQTITELNQFLVGPFYSSIYQGQSFDGDTAYHTEMDYNTHGYLGGYSRFLGTIRIGQLRVSSQSCTHVDIIKSNNGSLSCFPEYSNASSSSAQFGYSYNYTSSVSNEPSFVSISNRVYPGPNFNVYLNNTENNECNFSTMANCTVYEQLDSLRAHKFFDKATRAVFIDLTIYNPNFDSVCVVRLFLEITVAGGIIAKKTFAVFRMFQYHNPEDYVMLAFEVIIILVVIFQGIEECYKMKQLKWAYFKMKYNVAHDVNIALFLLITVLRVLKLKSLPSHISSNEYMPIRFLTQYAELEQNTNSLNCFLSILKLFKFLSFIPIFAQLTSTVGAAFNQLVGMFIMISILLFGGSLAFTIAFGTSLANYSVLPNSFYSLLRVFTLRFDFEEIRLANRVLGPLFFVCFIALITLVIMHMLIAVFEEAYMDRKETFSLMKEMEFNTLGKDIYDHVMNNILFRIPVLGHRVIQPLYEHALKTSQDIVKKASEIPSIVSHSEHSEKKYIKPSPVHQNPSIHQFVHNYLLCSYFTVHVYSSY